MSEASQNVAPAANVRKLSDAVREMRNAAADREDVVVEMREAGRMRLELLAQELQPVFAEVPQDDPTFDFAISSGTQPRLWIDAVAHVTMGRDRRTYRFVRDTRMGRVVLAESTDMAQVADHVTRYIAERVVERQRMVEGEVEALPRGVQPVRAAGPRPRSRWRAFFSGLLLVLAGGLVGAGSVFFFLSERFPEIESLLR
ncbi:hypothetical protein [Chelativorans intermedius]|uniref:Uncharacterized protein n=1 Tax=Chelativorans intermedius TaxID=515947 RepID=A0ABV6D973_9HYPH|nr:hypothetical protein [Chelativorans intermedius]MCT8999971.1 hypothetical protein [Chelativorans intermedius]